MSVAKRLKKHREDKANGTYKPAAVVVDGAGRAGHARNMILIDRNHTMQIDQNAAPFEYMSSSGLLRSKDDPIDLENARFSAGMRLRSLIIGAEPRSLKTVDLEGIPSGSNGLVNIADFKLDCIEALREVRTKLENDGRQHYRTIWRESQLYLLLERLVYRDDWSVIEVPKAQRKAVVDRIHYGLDCLSLMWGFIEPKEFSRRWG